MYLGIDVGATKTLFAVFDEAGKLVFEHKIPTNHDYEQFKADIAGAARGELAQYQFKAVCCAVPGWIDFKNSIVLGFGNLHWQNIHIKDDLEQIFNSVPILIHNDAKLAGLSESILLHKKYRKLLYITISTGIGGGVIIDDIIDPDFANFEPGQMLFDFNGQRQKWESFASGKAMHERYGKLASEISDPAIWEEYVKTLVVGFEDLLATIQPDAVVIGGG
jgi:glucokinase